MIEEVLIVLGLGLLFGGGSKRRAPPCYEITVETESGPTGTRYRAHASSSGLAPVHGTISHATELEARDEMRAWLVGQGGTICGDKLPSGGRKPSGGLSETACSLRVNVDGRELSICKQGTRWRMFVDHSLDPRTFADLAGVLQRAILVTRPHEAARVSLEHAQGTASIIRNAAGDGFDWTWTPPGAGAPTGSGTAPTMMDALGNVYEAHGKELAL